MATEGEIVVNDAAPSTHKLDTRSMTAASGHTVDREVLIIGDDTTPGSTARVTGASTAAVVGDPALVVAISPNSRTVAIAGTASVAGTVASGGTDSGNPVKMGGVFNTTQPTVGTGQRVDAQATARGALIVAPGTDGFATKITDGTNTVAVRGAGPLTTDFGAVVRPLSAPVPVHVNATLISNGSTILSTNAFPDQTLSLVVNIKASPSGTSPTLTFSLQEVDPGDGATVFGPVYTGQVLTAVGVSSILMPTMTGNQVKVSWTLTGSASPSFNQVYATLISKTTTQVRRSMSATYGSCSDIGGVSSGTSATTLISVGYLFHPSSVGLVYRLMSVVVSWTGGVGGDKAVLELMRITAENGTPGGFLQSKQGNNNSNAASSAIFRTGATGAPTRPFTAFKGVIVNLGAPGSVEFRPDSEQDGQDFELQRSVAEGWEMLLTTGPVAMTVAAGLFVSMSWREESQ